MKTLDQLEAQVTEVPSVFLNRKVKAKIYEGMIEIDIKQAYKLNLTVQCDHPSNKFIRIQDACISKCARISPNEQYQQDDLN